MKRVMLTVAYDGTNYHGWQLQSNGISIEEVFKPLPDAAFEGACAGHRSQPDGRRRARWGNIAVFDTQARMPGEKFSYALNQRLPEDIRIRDSREVPADFHPRKTDSIKTYEYRILNEEFPNPVKRLYSHFTYIPLDEKRMREAALLFVGEHDFKSFCSVNAQVESTVRTIYSCDVAREGTELIIRISGAGFLYNMVRIIAGTLMEIGSGKYPPEAVKEMLEAKNRAAAGPTAPARGLTLISYEFPALKEKAGQQAAEEKSEKTV